MQDFMIRNYGHIKLSAEHSVLPIHMLAIGHYYSLATIVAFTVCTAYALASIYHHRKGADI